MNRKMQMPDLIQKHLHPEAFSGPDFQDIQLLIDQIWEEFKEQHYDQGQAYSLIIGLLVKYVNDVGMSSRQLFEQFTTTLKILVKHEEIPL